MRAIQCPAMLNRFISEMSGKRLSVTLVLALVALIGPFVIPTAIAQKSIAVCHGEYEFKCKAHFYQVFEHCGDDNGVGGADPKVSGSKLCGSDNFLGVEPAEGGGISGNHCGYSWYVVKCKN
jgi:hypothetical protein